MLRAAVSAAKGWFAALATLAGVAVCVVVTAQAATSASLTLTGTISPKCEFTLATPGKTFPLEAGIIDIGDLGYTCNLPEGSYASFTLTITNGGLKNASTGTVVPYDVQWNVPANDGTQPWQDAAIFLNGVPFQWVTSAPGVERKGLFRIRIPSAPASLPAGTYSSVVTYTISP